MNFFKSTLAALLLTASLFAEPFSMHEPQVAIQNQILTKVNDNTISVIDVMKKMDLLLHQHYPQIADTPQGRFQFYSQSWRPIFMEMIDTELILADAAEKEVKLTDGEIREELENRFGPNVLLTLDKIGLTYDDAWKMLRKEMIVQRMMWFFVHSKAMQTVSPQEIRQSYRLYLAENPSYQDWKYRVISLRSDKEEEALARELHQFVLQLGQSPESIGAPLKEWESSHPGCNVTVSTEYVAKDKELSTSHQSALAPLSPGHYGDPIGQNSRTEKRTVYRIFYLAEKNDHPAPVFEEMAQKLKNELMQKAVAKESSVYLQKLRKHYGFDPSHLKESVPDDLTPFSIQ